jgi:beta-lactamase regulating signal transducer with metallopeptidase domain
MMFPAMQSVSAIAFERLLYCLVVGSVIALAITVAMRFIAQKSSRTKFLIWFSALLATALLPLINLKMGHMAAAAATSKPLVTLPFAVAVYVFAGWALLACIGLLRVAAAVRQVSRLRRDSEELDIGRLAPELQSIVKEFRKVRPVSILLSQQVQVPTAVGFRRSAVILPAWMVEEGTPEELKHVLLHELAHLRHRDDWTNLIQKLVKAILFFHPGVWWMERELSMHREIACDDSVLAQTASPRTYAECLARVAEKSFLKRQMALAQAAVSRMRQLSVRVGRILDPNRKPATQSWRPAIPAVVALALVSGATVSSVPELVKVEQGSSPVAASAVVTTGRQKEAAITPVLPAAKEPAVRAWSAAMNLKSSVQAKPRSLYVPARHAASKKEVSPRVTQARAKRQDGPPIMLAQYGQSSGQNHDPRAFVLVIETRQTITQAANGWQVSVQQLRWLVPVSQTQKSAPNKT